jgi:hypothetical protein
MILARRSGGERCHFGEWCRDSEAAQPAKKKMKLYISVGGPPLSKPVKLEKTTASQVHMVVVKPNMDMKPKLRC